MGINTGNIYIFSVMFIYFGILFLFAIRTNLSIKTFSDYTMGGRKLGPLLCAMNAGASDMSSWLMMGLPGAFYIYGMNQIWIIIGLVAGSWASWKIVAKKLRVQTEKMDDCLTIPLFLEKKFNDNTGTIRTVSSVTIIVFFTVYIASCLVGGAKLFSEVLGTGYITSLIISYFLITGYAYIGGFLAISWGDLLQGTLMLIAVVALPVIMYFNMSKSIDVVAFLSVKEGFLNPFNDTTLTGILTTMAWGLGYFGQPHIVSKYMAIKNPDDLSVSRRICTIWMTIAMLGAAASGILGSIFFVDKKLDIVENVLISASNLLTHQIFFGLILTSVLAAIMSTINGQLIICSGLITENFYTKVFNKQATQQEMINVSRMSILIVGVVAVLISLNQNSSILQLVSHAWSGLGASLGPVMLFALYSKKTTRNAAIAGIIGGGLASAGFAIFPIFVYELLPAFCISCILISGVSYLNNRSKL